MCYSAESSLISFIVGATGSLYLINSENNTNKHIGLFLLVVTMVQLLEFLMWIDQDCGILNDIASRSILLILSAQVYIIFLGAYLYDTFIIDKKILKILLIPLTIAFLYNGSYSYFSNKKNWCSKPNEDKSLQWANSKSHMIWSYVYYTAFIISPLLLKEIWKGLLILILGVISYIFTRYKNGYSSNSRWCYYSAFTPIVFIILDKIKL